MVRVSKRKEYRVIQDLQKFVNTTALSDSSINIILRGMRAFLNYCRDFGYLPDMPFYKSLQRETKKREVIPYSDGQLQLIVKEFNKTDREYSLWLLFMRYSGFRAKESLLLSWDRIDFDKQTIKVANKITRNEFQEFPITNTIKEILTEIKIITKHHVRPRQTVFRWKASSISRLRKRLSECELRIEEETGIKIKSEGRAFHRLRSAFANDLIDNAEKHNLSIFDIKDLMRHHDISTTLNFYKENKTQKLANKLSKLEDDGKSLMAT